AKNVASSIGGQLGGAALGAALTPVLGPMGPLLGKALGPVIGKGIGAAADLAGKALGNVGKLFKDPIGSIKNIGKAMANPAKALGAGYDALGGALGKIPIIGGALKKATQIMGAPAKAVGKAIGKMGDALGKLPGLGSIFGGAGKKAKKRVSSVMNMFEGDAAEMIKALGVPLDELSEDAAKARKRLTKGLGHKKGRKKMRTELMEDMGMDKTSANVVIDMMRGSAKGLAKGLGVGKKEAQAIIDKFESGESFSAEELAKIPKDVQDALGLTMKQTADVAREATGSGATAIGEAAKEGMGDINDSLAAGAEAVCPGCNSAVHSMESGILANKAALDKAAGKMADVDILGKTDLAGDAEKGIEKQTKKMKDKIGGLFGKAGKETLSKVEDEVSTTVTGKSPGPLSNLVGGLFGSAGKETLKSVTGALGELGTKLPAGSKVVEVGVKEAIKNAVNPMHAMGRASQLMGKGFDALGGVVGKVPAIGGALEGASKLLGKGFSGMGKAMTSPVATLSKAFTGYGKLMDKIPIVGKVLGAGPKAIGKGLDVLSKGMGKALGGASKAMGKLAGGVFKGIGGLFGGAGKKAKKRVGAVMKAYDGDAGAILESLAGGGMDEKARRTLFKGLSNKKGRKKLSRELTSDLGLSKDEASDTITAMRMMEGVEKMGDDMFAGKKGRKREKGMRKQLMKEFGLDKEGAQQIIEEIKGGGGADVLKKLLPETVSQIFDEGAQTA
ncbi:hypothetical protein DRJ16_06920, partial [Candidatus Woesearchaeota archaeon]